MTKDNYEKLATSVLSTTLNDNRQTRLIDGFLKRTGEDELVFYVNLLEGLTNSKFYKRQLRQRGYGTKIVAKVNGTLLFKDIEATGYDPLLVFGNEDSDLATIEEQLSKLIEQHGIEKKEIPNIFIIDGVFIHLAHKNIPSDYTDLNVIFCYNIGDRVKKNRTLMTVEVFFYTAGAKKMMRRFENAKKYCEVRIKLLKKHRGIIDDISLPTNLSSSNSETVLLPNNRSKKKKNITEIKKQQLLKDIFYPDRQPLYDSTINKLLELRCNGKFLFSTNFTSLLR